MLDNCSSIPKIYRKVSLPCSFIKIFAIEVSTFLKNYFIKTSILRCSILWCWAIPWVVELSSAFYRYKLCIRLVLKLKIKKLHTWGHAQIDGKLLKSPKIALFTIFCQLWSAVVIQVILEIFWNFACLFYYIWITNMQNFTVIQY